jgi:hypothetical protein
MIRILEKVGDIEANKVAHRKKVKLYLLVISIGNIYWQYSCHYPLQFTLLISQAIRMILHPYSSLIQDIYQRFYLILVQVLSGKMEDRTNILCNHALLIYIILTGC